MGAALMELHGLGTDDLRRHVGRLDQVAGVRLVELADGPARGVRVLEFRSGAGLAFEVVVDRCFDLGPASIDGIPLNWTSPVGVQGPWYREPESLGWLRGFGGGLMVTGGLDHTLFPDTDDAAHFRYPPQETLRFPLHGRASGLPARLVGYGERWDGDSCTLWAEAEVEQTAVFGEALRLRRRIECEVGGNDLTLHDEVTNEGARPTSNMMLYHVNLGFPLIAEGSRLVVDATSAEPRGDVDMASWTTFAGPTEGFVEEVVEIRPAAPDGWARAAVVNAAGDLAVGERYRADTLPYLFCWRMLGERTYVVGLEPSTNSSAGRHDARDRGELTVLEPGQRRTYELTLAARRGYEAVGRLIDDISSD